MIRPFRHALTPLAIAVLAAVLSGCATPKPAVGVKDRLSVPYVEAQHQYYFAHGKGSLSHAERSGINTFLQSLALRDGDAMFVTIPTSGSPVADAHRKENLAAALARVPARVSFSMDESFAKRPLQPRQIGLIRVARPQGIKVDCDPGVKDLGCANAINLAVMIHAPADVLAPANTARTAQQ